MVFFESGEEAFIHVDLVGKKLTFRSKDPEYHTGIVASLGA